MGASRSAIGRRRVRSRPKCIERRRFIEKDVGGRFGDRRCWRREGGEEMLLVGRGEKRGDLGLGRRSVTDKGV